MHTTSLPTKNYHCDNTAHAASLFSNVIIVCIRQRDVGNFLQLALILLLLLQINLHLGGCQSNLLHKMQVGITE